MQDDHVLPDDFVLEPRDLHFHRVEHYQGSTVAHTTKKDLLDYLEKLFFKNGGQYE